MTPRIAQCPQAIIACCCLAAALLPGLCLAQDWIYTVRPGDTIWTLSGKYLKHQGYWRRLQAHNRVTEPDRLQPGSRLRFPVSWLRIQPAAVRVVDIRGEVEGTAPDTGQAFTPAPGQALGSGMRLRTGAGASITLEFADGSRLLLQERSDLTLDTLSAYGDTGMVDTRLRLQRGRTSSQVVPAPGPGTRFIIDTPAAVSTVRGTDFRVAAEPAESVSRTEVLQGRVGVRGGRAGVLVPAGFGSVAQRGRTPTAPARLLPPPDTSALPPVLERSPLPLRWTPLEGAVRYRVQIAPDRSFASLLFDAVSERPRIEGPDLPDGDYVLRLRGIDGRGLEGEDGYHRFTLNARPEPPFIIAPQDGTTVREATPRFQWAGSDTAASYRLQIAAGADFAAALLDLADLDDTSLRPELAMEPGVYHWRVAMRTGDGGQGPFSDPQRFELKPAPASPELEEPAVAEDTMTFRWRAGLPGQRYRFQLAQRADFEAPLVDRHTAEPSVTIPRPEAGAWYLRIQTIDDDGYAGPFGPAQRISVPVQTYWGIIGAALVMLLLVL